MTDRLHDTAITRRQLMKGVGLAGAAALGMGLSACSSGSSSGSAASTSASASASSQAASPTAPASSYAAASTVAPQPAGKNLVAFFSRAGENYEVGYVDEGSTEIVAYMISGKVVSEVFRIEPAEPYPESYDETLAIAQRELDEDARPELAEEFGSLDGYGTIYLGFPTWHMHMPRIVLTFLESLDWTGKTIAPFNTSGSAGFGSTLDELKAACPGAKVLEGLTIIGSTVQNDTAATEQAVNAWLAKVRK